MDRYRNISVTPLTRAIGAEIDSVDLADLSDESFYEIKRALLDHQVLFFHNQDLSINQQRAFTRLFGPPSILPYVQAMEDYPDVIAVLKEADEVNVGVFGGNWHTDFSFLPEPPLGSVLYAKEVPPYGGDTIWANMCAAYDALDEETKSSIDDLIAVHAGVPYGSADSPSHEVRSGRSMVMTRCDPDADRETEHPLVCIHPDTGRRMLFVNPTYTTRVAGMTAGESRGLLDRLYAHCIRPEFTCRYRWRRGDVAVWDNRCTIHYAINDYDGFRRLMYRTAIAGTRPRGVKESDFESTARAVKTS